MEQQMEVSCCTNSINFKAGSCSSYSIYYGAEIRVVPQNELQSSLKCFDSLPVPPPSRRQDMTREQIGAEKVALQKALLYYESIHGRPVSHPPPLLFRINKHTQPSTVTQITSQG